MNNATAPPAVTPVEPVSRAQLLRTIADAIENDGLPEPYQYNLTHHRNVGEMHLSLRMEQNDAEGVAAWAALIGGQVKISELRETVREGHPDYRVHTLGEAVASPVKWHGWAVEVWAAIHEPQGGDR